MVFATSSFSYADTFERSLISQTFALSDLEEMFPDAIDDIEFYQYISFSDNSTRSSSLSTIVPVRVYTTNIDSTEYTLTVYDNGFLKLDYEITLRSMKYFVFFFYGAGGTPHQLIMSVYYTTNSSGRQIITSIGPGGVMVNIYEYGVDYEHNTAYIGGNAYYYPDQTDDSFTVEYIGMYMTVGCNSSGILEKTSEDFIDMY